MKRFINLSTKLTIYISCFFAMHLATLPSDLFCNKACANSISTDKISYAKILENCYLYKTNSMSPDINNIYFCLPETYFVSVLSSETNNILKVRYSSYVGYCYSNTLSIVSFTPNICDLNGITFDIHAVAGTQVWSLPSDTKGVKYTTIPAGTTKIEYIASTSGDIPIGGTTNLWYYARFTPASHTTSVYEGYIFSEATTNLSNIANNLETEPIVDPPNLDSTITINGALKVVLIILICLPFAILFLVSLTKAIRQIKNKKQNNNQDINDQRPAPQNSSYLVKKDKPKTRRLFSDTSEPLETIEVSFPQYDYIDDDDLL